MYAYMYYMYNVAAVSVLRNHRVCVSVCDTKNKFTHIMYAKYFCVPMPKHARIWLAQKSHTLGFVSTILNMATFDDLRDAN